MNQTKQSSCFETLPQPLTQEEECILIKQLEQGDKDAACKLIEGNLRLVVTVASQFENLGMSLEDLVSIGTIGLIKGVSTCTVGTCDSLKDHLSRYIEWELEKYLMLD